MNSEVQDIETYKIFVVPVGNGKNTEEIEFHPRAPVIKYESREDLDDKEVPKDSVAPSDNIEKAKEDFVAPNSEIDKTTR